MEAALDMARSKDTKERMAGVERLHELLESSTRQLPPGEVTSLVDACVDLLRDNNFKVSQGALQCLSSAAVLAGEHFKLHFNALVPAVVERLGDAKQPVRDAARQLLVTLMEVSSPTIIVERAGSYAWAHKSWRVREEFARTVTTAIGLFASTELPLQRVLLPPVLQLLNDSSQIVRDAATACIEEMYRQSGTQFRDELQRHPLPSSMMREINFRLEKIEPKVRPADGHGSSFFPTEMKSSTVSQKRSSPKVKSAPRETFLTTGVGDVTEKPIDPIKVYSEKELIQEFEKIASSLAPEKDWLVRIAAMQRVEGLVCGGAADYPPFLTLIKQLIAPLITQLSDRRSAIVKQACHLLNFLSKELLGDFEACAEVFIPALFKLVVITVLVIAESADNCIKTMLRNCKVARVLPRIADSAKNDRSAVLRARCCEYALLILEYWTDAPEIQRSADLYEDLIKRCVADAMSEVRATARTCYRMFSKTWPERSRRLFQSFDPVIQRIIQDEDGGMHKRYSSPSLRERGVQLSTAPSPISGYGTSAIVAMDRSTSSVTGTSLSTGALLLSHAKPLGKSNERSLESVLHSSKQKVSAIESLLKGGNLSERHNSLARSTSLDLGVDSPSSRDPPFPPAVSTSTNYSLRSSLVEPSVASNNHPGGSHNGGSSVSDLVSQNPSFRDSSKAYIGSLKSNSLSAISLSYSMKKPSERLQEGSYYGDNIETRQARRFLSLHSEKQYQEVQYRDPSLRDSQNNYVPNFQRPLLRKQIPSRAVSGRSSFEENQLFAGETTSYVDGPASLNDALTEGLSPSSDWVARVSAFSYLRGLLQQGPKGIQEVAQSFEKVMKLFFQHLDDPHHKVAQAALLTLAEIIPACRKPFESYLERTLPHVFSRLIDPKELVRQPCSTTLEIVSRTYNIDSLLPALLRSLDEQRSPKAKLAVIEFANNSFNSHVVASEASGNNGFLKLWLAKLAPLVNDKNTKLKEVAITGIISVHTRFDSTAVLNFILSLSVDEQNTLRRALKQFTPRIEVDLVNFLQSKKERQRARLGYDPLDIVGTSSDEGYAGSSKKSPYRGRSSAGSLDNDGGRKWSSMQEPTRVSVSTGQTLSDDAYEFGYQNFDASSDTDTMQKASIKDLIYTPNPSVETTGSWINHAEKVDPGGERESILVKPGLDIGRLVSPNGQKTLDSNIGNELSLEVDLQKSLAIKNNSEPDHVPSILQLLHQISSGNDENSIISRREALKHLVDASKVNDQSVWTKYFNQILTAVLEVLEDPESSIRELVLSLVAEMLTNQKYAIEDSIEIVIEKLLQATKDGVVKITNEAHHCLTIVLSQYDHRRCLGVVVPLLVTEDEKMLVTCINCLTKLVGRFPEEELMVQMPSFLPSLFDAFGNQSADVRKSVVFCLVDIYIMLGKAFLPHLKGLNSTQLRLVTIYANRISQARSGVPIDATNG